MMSAVAARAPDRGKFEQDFGSVGTRRIFDANTNTWMVKIFPGEFYITANAEETLVTVLGSCVAACIRDPRLGIGGMNHFMLPQGRSGGWGKDSQSTRFGNFAMEKLINELLKAGCSRDSLEVKLFGGGNVTDSNIAVGTGNAEFALRYVDDEKLRCVAQDLGGRFPRRIHYSPADGKVVRRLLGRDASGAVVREEMEHAQRLSSRAPAGEIELFGD
ncbi:chemoreceptor glutamine deamidase CheD [Pseudorhodoplanes sinuspersici]|nr:chemoreceptor glutamine deamidase CheD [Pseudorhodoplanes sinuspersici]RKE69715.1 CheD activator of MCP protein methylation [Pseudorhodoplanes sinuspersici]